MNEMDERGYRLNRIAMWAETAWMVAFGFMVIEYVYSGNMELLLSPAWNWLEVSAGVVLVMAGAAMVLMDREDRRRYLEGVSSRGAGREPAYRLAGAAVLLLVFAVGLVVPGRTLTAGIQTSAEKGVGVFETGGVDLEEVASRVDKDFRDWLIITRKDPEPSHHRGEVIKVTGMVVRMEDMPENEFMLVRYLFTHCIACARPVGFLCRVPDEDEIPEGETWVALEGVFEVGELRGERVPVIEVYRYREVSPPDDPYIYP